MTDHSTDLAILEQRRHQLEVRAAGIRRELRSLGDDDDAERRMRVALAGRLSEVDAELDDVERQIVAAGEAIDRARQEHTP